MSTNKVEGDGYLLAKKIIDQSAKVMVKSSNTNSIISWGW